MIWTDFAIENLKNIFDFYSKKANKKIAHKIRKDVLATAKQLLKNPNSGQIEFNLLELNQNHRYLVCGNFKIIYRIEGELLIISDIFDGRQNPIKINDDKRQLK